MSGKASEMETAVEPADRAEGRLARGARVVWPHALLLSVYVAYLLVGGAVFLAIEGGRRTDLNAHAARYETLRSAIGQAASNVSEGRPVSAGIDLAALWEEYMDIVDGLYLDHLDEKNQTDWTFTGSVLFCATSISTIGYGDAVPVTPQGRAAIVVYSLIGIPLTLTFLADIGALLAKVVRTISVRLTSCRRKKKGGPPAETGASPPAGQARPAGAVEALRHVHVHRPSVHSVDTQSIDGDLYEMRTSLGVFRDFSESVRMGNGGSRGSSRQNSLTEPADRPRLLVPGTDGGGGGPRPHRQGHTAATNPAYSPDDVKVGLGGSGGCGEEKEAEEEERKSPNGHGDARHAEEWTCRAEDESSAADVGHHHVPVYVVVSILVLYTLLGALVIARVEGWLYGEALYFTFITLTTIGFGDFVPVKHYRDIPSFFGCLVYTIVGLSVMSMCIALVQAKVVSLLSRAAGRIGF